MLYEVFVKQADTIRSPSDLMVDCGFGAILLLEGGTLYNSLIERGGRCKLVSTGSIVN